MKTNLLVTIALILLAPAASGAEPVAVKGPIAAWYDKLPPPPKTAAEAVAKLQLGKHCPATVLDASLNAAAAQVKDYRRALTEYAHELDNQEAGEMFGPAMKAYMAKIAMLQDPKKMQSMTPSQMTALQKELEALQTQIQAEQQKMLSNPHAADAQLHPPQVVEAADVAAAVKRAEENWNRLRREKGDSWIGDNPLRDERDKLQQQIEEQVRSTCKSYEKDPKGLKECLRGQRQPCIKRHLELALKQLAQYQELWPREKAEFKAVAIEADRVLAPVQYGDKAKGLKARKALLGYQEMVYAFYDLLDLSTNAYVETGRWQLAQLLKDGEPGACECDLAAGPLGREYTSKERTEPKH